MIGLLKQKTPANILVLFVFGILIKLPIFRHPYQPSANAADGILYRNIIDALNSYGKSSPIIFPILAYLLIFTQALQLNKLINDQRMMQKTTYLPAASYLLVTSLQHDWNLFSPNLLVNSLVLLVFNGLFRLYNQQRAKGIIFNIGLAIGISAFLFLPSILFYAWLLFGLLVMRPVRLNEWLICLLGVTAPFYFYAAYLFIVERWSWDKLIQPFSFETPQLEQSFWLATSGFLLIVPFLVGGYYVQDHLRRMLIQVRKGWSLFLIYLLFALFIPFLSKSSESLANWVLIVIPFAAFHACAYLYPPQRWFPVIIFWVSVLFVLAYQYFGSGW